MANAIADYQKQLQTDLEALRDRMAPPSSNRIKAENKLFTLPNGQTNHELEVVILDWRCVNTLYKGAYNPAKPQGPVCWAIGDKPKDLAPSTECVDPQAESCAVCTFDKFGTAQNGKGKACKNQRRLAVVGPNADETTEVLTLGAPPSSISLFENYVMAMRSTHGALPIQLLTKITFDPDVAFTKFKFELVRALEEEELGAMLGLRQRAKDPLELGFEAEIG